MTTTVVAAPAVSRQQAITIAEADALPMYGAEWLNKLMLRAALHDDGWHVEYHQWRPRHTGGARHKDGIVMLSARTVVPYEAKLPSFFGKIAGAPPLEVGMNELVPLANATEALAAGEVVDADVDRTRAESMASNMLLRAVSPANALYAKYEPKIHASTFCLYPLYYARYRYEGEARSRANEDFFVAVSGRSGEIVAAKHPSSVRAMANKLRKLLSFDRR